MSCGNLFRVTYLKHGNKVDIVFVDHFVHELDKLFDESLVLLQPRGVEVETKRSAVCGVVPVEVVSQHPAELFGGLDVGASGNQVATRKALVKVRIVSPVQLIDDHFPDGVAARGAPLSVAVALVGHPVVQGVRPDGNSTQGSCDGGVIDEELIGHHLKLLVAADPEIGGPDTNDRSVGDVGEPLNDEPGTGHLSQPIIICSLGPVFWIILVGYREDSDFMASSVQFLNS